MLNLLIFGNALILLILLVVSFMIISYKSPILDKEKNRAFECGFTPRGSSRINFCIKFFLVGVVFLIFDVEVCLIIPLPFGHYYIILFLVILMVGLLYEWFYGGLD